VSKPTAEVVAGKKFVALYFSASVSALAEAAHRDQQQQPLAWPQQLLASSLHSAPALLCPLPPLLPSLSGAAPAASSRPSLQ